MLNFDMLEPIKHHYLPAFYLRRWSGVDGRLCQFSRPYKEIVPNRRHPEQTGYVERLYEMKGLPSGLAQQIERNFMQPVDALAAEALAALEASDQRIERDARLRSAWSRFVMSLLMRMPEDIAALKKGVIEEWARRLPDAEALYASKKGADDPKSLAAYLEQLGPEEMDRWAMSLVPTLIDHSEIGAVLNNMRWLIVRISSNDGEFLTSDRPVLTTATLLEEGAYVFLPIGPEALFVAVNDIETQRRVEERNPIERVESINRYVTGHAVKYVYARDDSALDYVRAYMGTQPRMSLMERLVAFRKAQHQGGRRL